MYVPEKLKLNKFIDVKIPTASEYFRRFGDSLSVPPERYSGDELASFGKTKIQSLEEVESYNRMMQRVELENAKNNQSPKDDSGE